MDIYETIRSSIDKAVADGKEHFAIYPFGTNGITTKGILNWCYGINEEVVVDKAFTGSQSVRVKKIEEINEPSCYTWLVNCSTLEVRKSILESLKDVPQEKIIDMFAEDCGRNYNKERPLVRLSEEESNINNIVCQEFEKLVKEMKANGKVLTIAEIGVDIGATTFAVSKLLKETDTYYLFDFEDVVQALAADLRELPEILCNYIEIGNTHKIYDSYVWNLSKLVLKMREDGKNGIFDAAYLDGAHNLIHDGLACCLLKELIKPEGFLVFDDVNWSYAISPTCNPKVNPGICNGYTEEQICDCQVKRVIRLFMEQDEKFERIEKFSKGGREVWRRK